MDARRRFTLTVLAPAVIALGACASVTAGQGSARSGGSAPTGGRSPGARSSGMPIEGAGLAALLERGAASISTAHLSLNIAAGGQTVQGDGDETLSDGALASLDLTETVTGAGTLRLRIVGVNAYAALPPALNHFGKPWVLVSSSSGDAVIRSLSQSLDSARNAASLRTPALFARAASSVTLRGPDQVAGAAAFHYVVVVDTSKLPSDYPGREEIMSAGITKLPIDLWLDARGRPLKLTQQITIGGATVSTNVTLSKLNSPVHITAPPADQISTA